MACTSINRDQESDTLRRKGNELYTQIREGEGKLTTIVLRIRLAKARQCYSEAARTASSQDQKASALKNIARLCFIWAKLELREYRKNQETDNQTALLAADSLMACKCELVNSIGHLAGAQKEGASVKAREWLQVLDGQLMELVRWASAEDPRTELGLLRAVCRGLNESGVPPCEASYVAQMDLAEGLFKQGVMYMDRSEQFHSKDYKTCLRFMHDIYRPLNEAESIFDCCQKVATSEHLKEIKDMKDQVQLYIRMGNSMQAIKEGDHLINRAVFEEVSLNMDLSLLAIDKYLEAAVLTREKDAEIEAIAMSKLGKIYSDVLKMPTKAHKYHFQAITLALTIMSPRIARSDWYVYSSGMVKKQQDSRMQEEEKDKEEANKAILLKLADKIKVLKEKSELNAKSFLEFLYKEHKHPNPNNSLESNQDDTKEALRKAILHYHPDTNGRYGQEWVVLCNEITKLLNNKYESFK